MSCRMNMSLWRLTLTVASLVPACGGAMPPGDAGPGVDVTPDVTPDAPATPADATCTSLASVSFQVRVAEGSANRYCIGSECSRVWMWLRNDQGDEVGSFGESACSPAGCNPICLKARPMADVGESATWSTSTCQGNTCVEPMCTRPGKYVAKMCARLTARGSDGGTFCDSASTSPMTCVDVEFEYPATTVVQGILP